MKKKPDQTKRPIGAAQTYLDLARDEITIVGDPNENPGDKRLTYLIQDWLNEVDWEDEVEFDDVERRSRVVTGVSGEGNDYRVFIEALEENQWLSVFFYSAINVPEKRLSDAYQLVNKINLDIGVGRFAIASDRSFQFKATIDAEGTVLSTRSLQLLVGAAERSFRQWISSFGKIAFTELSADQILREAEEHSSSDARGPTH